MAAPAEIRNIPASPGVPDSWVPEWAATAVRLCSFGAIAGCGWCLDMAIFTIGVHLGVMPMLANAVSAGSAATIVYWSSVRRIFHCRKVRLERPFYGYLVLQIVIIATCSWLIGFIDRQIHVMPLITKIALTPFCFLANYGGMILLTRERSRA